ncbi:hypothetical protein EK599_13455 [Vibrio sp. T187]|uniref:hypothetical protein n=1 Tax=Vibrio TaxID=662 RepID=UPI0010C99CDB|nr:MULTISPECIES: hypothetical protein [Vibrio]MBW3696705.1 hypothetical protein [Vibrio sp. T187]
MWESPSSAITWLKSNGFTRTAASVEYANCQFPRFQTSDLSTDAHEGRVRYVALVLQILSVMRPEIIIRPPLTDLQPGPLYSCSNIIYLSHNIILPQIKRRSRHYLLTQIQAAETALTSPYNDSVRQYFAYHRRRTGEILANQTAGTPVATFKNLFEANQREMANHPRTNLTITMSQIKGQNLRQDPVVFMGLKAVPENVVNSILINGLVPLRYLYDQEVMNKAKCNLNMPNDRQANYLRRRFALDLPRVPNNNLDVCMLLKMANAHKSGPGVTTSGFHSTSGKPDYAVEYSRGSAGSNINKVSYNMGLAIRVTPESYPLIIQDGIEQWNKYNEEQIVMSFSKDDKKWKHDYESEILLGGATPASDFLYVGLARVTAKPIVGSFLGDISGGFKKKKRKKSKKKSLESAQV